MLDLWSLPPVRAREALTAWLAACGEPPYRAKQVLPRLWHHPVGAWDEARELPAALRAALTTAFPPRRLLLVTRQHSTDRTAQFRWDLGDGEAIESVLIPAR